jgi:hypothetical protein
LVPSLKDLLSFLYFPYATSCILSFILWFPVVLLVSSHCFDNLSNLLSRPSLGSYPSPCLPALHLAYVNPSFDHPLHKVMSSQQVRSTRYPLISTMTSCSKTPVPLSDDGLHYSSNHLATLNDRSVTDLSYIDTTTIQELHQALAQSVGLAQHLLANP